jgi:hypothetical protein
VAPLPHQLQQAELRGGQVAEQVPRPFPGAVGLPAAVTALTSGVVHGRAHQRRPCDAAGRVRAAAARPGQQEQEPGAVDLQQREVAAAQERQAEQEQQPFPFDARERQGGVPPDDELWQ